MSSTCRQIEHSNIIEPKILTRESVTLKNRYCGNEGQIRFKVPCRDQWDINTTSGLRSPVVTNDLNEILFVAKTNITKQINKSDMYIESVVYIEMSTPNRNDMSHIKDDLNRLRSKIVWASTSSAWQITDHQVSDFISKISIPLVTEEIRKVYIKDMKEI